MNDRWRLGEFVRVEKMQEEIRILVREMGWSGPSTPTFIWRSVGKLPCTASESEIEDACLLILEDHRHFGVCGECDQRMLAGYMHNESTCQGCAPAKYGIVY